MKCIYKGDDAPDLITINYENTEGFIINKLYTTCGKITHTYNNPVFPFSEGYTAEETAQFELENTVYAGVEIEGKGKITFNGSASFRACPKVIDWEANNG